MLNSLVTTYKQTRLDDDFTKIYEIVSGSWANKKTIAQSIRASEHEVEALYEDVLLRCIERFDGKSEFMNFYKKAIVLERANLYRKKKRRHQQEVFEQQIVTEEDEDDGNPNHLDALYGTTEQNPFSTKKADQRQLIDFLLNGADEFTTAIVKAFLAHPKPTATTIAKEFGVHHSKVTRALHRLAAKHDTKQFDSHRDYLMAL